MMRNIYRDFFSFSTDAHFRSFQQLFKNEKLDNKSLEQTEVIKSLKRLLTTTDSPLITTLTTGTELFRCRKLGFKNGFLNTGGISYDESSDCLSGFDCFDSKEPPITISSAGRNNICGASYLYLTEDEYTACAEMRPSNLDILSLSKFEIKRDMKIFDLSVDVNVSKFDDAEKMISATRLISKIMSVFYLPVVDEKGYLMTQYLSDIIRKHGYDGICYLSSMSLRKNYTVFNCSESNVEFIGSELIRNNVTRYDLYRINDGSHIEPSIHEEICNVKGQDIQTIKERLINEVRGHQGNGQA